MPLDGGRVPDEPLFTLPTEAPTPPAPPPAPRTLDAVLRTIKADHDTAITTSGQAGLHSLTRSAKPIKRLHAYLKDELIAAGVPTRCIDLERAIPTLFGQKNQDVVAIPRGKNHPAGQSTLSIGVKSHLYGMTKNVDNCFSSIRAELLSLHEMHHDIVAGQVHMVALNQWDSDAAKQSRVAMRQLSKEAVASIIHRYALISGRKPGGSDGFSERVALLLVDFSHAAPVVYTDVAQLEADGFLAANSGLSLDHLTLDGFAQDLVEEHRARFVGNNRL